MMSLLIGIISAHAATQDGSTRRKAVAFDWEYGHVQTPVMEADGLRDWYWYRVQLDPLYENESPILALYLTNLSTDSADVHILADLEDQQEVRDYRIAPGDFKIWSINAGMLVRMKAKDVYIQLTSERTIALSADVYENIRLDQTCTSASWLQWSGRTQTELSKWYAVSLGQAMEAANNGKQVVMNFTPTASAAMLHINRSADCPSTATVTTDTLVAAGQTYQYIINRSMIDVLADSIQYYHVETNHSVDINISMQDEPAGPSIFSGTPQEFLLEQDYDLTAGQTYFFRLPMASIRADKMQPEFRAINQGNNQTEISYTYAFSATASQGTEGSAVANANDEVTVNFDNNRIRALNSSLEAAYFTVVATENITLRGRMRHMHEGITCKTARDITDENDGVRHEDTETVWYMVDFTNAEQQQADIEVFVVNNNATAKSVTIERAMECPFVETELENVTIAAGDTQRIMLRYGMYRNLTTSTMYYGITSTAQLRVGARKIASEVKNPPVEICNGATMFNIDGGHIVAAGEAGEWFVLPIDTIRKSALTPMFMYNNRTNAVANVRMEISYECPDMYSNDTYQHTLSANGSYVNDAIYEMISKLNASVQNLYLHVTTNQEIAIQLGFDTPESGTNCRTAIPFNWVSGHDQDSATTKWYKIDLRSVKKNGNDISVFFLNRGNTSTVLASLATECPCDQPQEERLTVQKNSKRERLITNASLETFEDIMWVRVTTQTPLHIEAHEQAPASFTPIMPDKLEQLNFNVTYTYPADGYALGDTIYYRFDSLSVKNLLDNEALTFRTTVWNGSSRQTVDRFMVYHLPITTAPMRLSMPLAAGQDSIILWERSAIAKSLTKDTIVIAFTADEPFTFSYELLDPNVGNDCAHALSLRNDRVEPYTQSSGIRWYRIDYATMDSTQYYQLQITNRGQESDVITVDVHNNCDAAAMRTFAMPLDVAQTGMLDMTAQLLGGLTPRSMYYAINCSDSVDVRLHSEPMQSTELSYACTAAIPMAANYTYAMAAGETFWYQININTIRESSENDVVIEIANRSTNEVTATRATAWDCPIDYDLVDVDYTIAPSDTLRDTLTRVMLNSIQDSIMYVRASATQDINVTLKVEMNVGDACDNPVEFDWVNGVVHPEHENMWYIVRLDSTKIPEDKDIRLSIQNLSHDTTTATAKLYFDCRDSMLTSISYTFEGDTARYKNIDRSLLSNLGWADMSIKFFSSHNTYLRVELIDSIYYEPAFDTVRAVICNGGDYLDTITGETHEMLFADEPQNLVWNDTVNYRDGTAWRDSITTFIITALIDPVALSDSLIMAYRPILKEGMPVFVDSSLAMIKRYYETILDSTQAAIDTIYWAVPQPGTNKETTLDLTAPIARNTSSKSLRLMVKTACQSTIRKDVLCMVEGWRTDSIVTIDTLCPGRSISIRGVEYTPADDQTIRLPMTNVMAADTLSLMRYVDSIYVAHLVVLHNPEMMPYGAINTAAGLAIDVESNRNILAGYYDYEDPSETHVDSIGFEFKTTDGDYEPLPVERLDSTVKQVTIRYNLYTSCGDTLHAPDTIIMVAPYIYKTKDMQAYLCPSDSVVTRNGTVIRTNLTMSDTVRWIVSGDDVAAFDSIYRYQVVVKAEQSTVADCPTPIVVKAGAAIDVTAQTAYYMNAYTTTNQALVQIDTILWEVQMDNSTSWVPLSTERLSRDIQLVKMRYYTVSECADTIRRNLFSPLWPEEYAYVSTAVDVQLCKDEVLETRTGKLCTIHADMQINDTVKWITSADIYTPAFDSVYVYHVTALQHTESFDTLLFCGGEEYSSEHPYYWAGLADTTITENMGGTFTVVRTNAQGCDSIMHLTIEVQNPHYDNLPIVSRYGNRILLINRKAIEDSTGWAVAASDVTWQRLNTNGDWETPSPEWSGVDYISYTINDNKPFSGSYRVIIHQDANNDGECPTNGTSITLILGDDAATAPENGPKKILRNGQLMIIVGDGEYNSQGVRHY